MSKTNGLASDIDDFLRQIDLDPNEYQSFSATRAGDADRRPAPRLNAPAEPPALLPTEPFVAPAEVERITGAAPARMLETIEAELGGATRGADRWGDTAVSLRVMTIGSGAGATTVVANLAYELTAAGETVLLADDSEDSVLPCHFGRRRPKRGLLTIVGAGGARAKEIHLLTRGAGANVGPVNHEEWVRRALDEVGAVDRVLIEVGKPSRALPNPAGVSMLVVGAEPNSIYRLPSALERLGESSTYLLLTRFDQTVELHCQIKNWLAERFGDRLVPVALRHDPSAAAALSAGRPVVEYARDCPLSQDLRELRSWLASRPGWGLSE